MRRNESHLPFVSLFMFSLQASGSGLCWLGYGAWDPGPGRQRFALGVAWVQCGRATSRAGLASHFDNLLLEVIDISLNRIELGF